MSFVELERERIKSEYHRREQELDLSLYAPWQPAEILMRSERKRLAATLLQKAKLFPGVGSPCLEIGFGSLGWLGDLISWGIAETDLHGIEIDAGRARRAQTVLPLADLRIGDATELPWDDGQFELIVVSTVFSSILDTTVRQMIAAQVTRVLAPEGAVLWYDLSVNNPRNPNVRKVSRREIRRLFPELEGDISSLTLAPPLARWVANRSWLLASIAGAFPPLRTHLLAVLTKRIGRECRPSR